MFASGEDQYVLQLNLRSIKTVLESHYQAFSYKLRRAINAMGPQNIEFHVLCSHDRRVSLPPRLITNGMRLLLVTRPGPKLNFMPRPIVIDKFQTKAPKM